MAIYTARIGEDHIAWLTDSGSTIGCAGLLDHVAEAADPNTMIFDGAVAAVLRDLPEDDDGHFDGESIWIGGVDYPVQVEQEAPMTAMTYTVQIQASNADGSIWQALHPTANVAVRDDEDVADVAQFIAANQTVADGGGWRVVLWTGADADTGTPPVYVLEAGTPVVVELYRGAAPDVVGTELLPEHRLDEQTWRWLREQGYGDDTDLWVNLVAPWTWRANNRPIAERDGTLYSGPAVGMDDES